MMKVNKIKLYSFVGMLTLSCVLLGCSSNQEVTPKEEVVEEPKEETTEQTPEEEKNTSRSIYGLTNLYGSGSCCL